MAGTGESTLEGEPNITLKVCVSLKRLLIVTFNIKAIRIKSSVLLVSRDRICYFWFHLHQTP